MKLRLGDLLALLIIIVLFIVASATVQAYGEELAGLVAVRGLMGAVAYVGIIVVAVVAAPVSAIPLLPVAAALWGPLAAALLSILGWTLGSVFAFVIARRYGRPLVGRFIKLPSLARIERLMPSDHLFISVVFLRMVLPVDMLSYALGLFSAMSLRSYTVATVIGITPFAFIFAYAASWPLSYQLMTAAVAIAIPVVGYWQYGYKSSSSP